MISQDCLIKELEKELEQSKEKGQELEQELEQLTKLEKELKKKNIQEIGKLIGPYLIFLVEKNGIKISLEMKEEIKFFYNSIKIIEDQALFFCLLKKGNDEKILGKLRIYSNVYSPIIKFNITNLFKNIAKSVKQLEVGKEATKKEKKYILNFFWLWKNMCPEMSFPTCIVELAEKAPADFFTNYRLLLEDVSHHTFFSNDLTKGLTFINKKTSDESYLRPIQIRMEEIKKEMQKEREIQRKKQREIIKETKKREEILNQLKREIKNKDAKFISYPIVERLISLHLETEIERIINHNEKVLANQEEELESLKEQFPDSFMNAFLDYGYNIILLPEEEIKKLKEKIDKKTVIELLQNMAHFPFINVKHPDFITIITTTSPEILKTIGKEVECQKLPSEYVQRYSYILSKTYYEKYVQNKKLILSQNMNVAFFLNNDILLSEPEYFKKALQLVITYHCSQIPFNDMAYFDKVDEIIEKRFLIDEDAPKLPDTLQTDTQELLNQAHPIDIEEIEEDGEIKHLDEHYKVDQLRYIIHGIIISRIKVLRYFKYLKQVRENDPHNIIDAILYNLQLFDFERIELLEELSVQKRKKIID